MNHESTGDPSWNDEMMSYRAEGMAWQPWKANQEFEIRYNSRGRSNCLLEDQTLLPFYFMWKCGGDEFL
jgi:hypothetical protein